MKVIFLDMDGVMNCAETACDSGAIAIDPYMVVLLHRILEATGAKVVLSTSWRHSQELVDVIDERVLMGHGHTGLTPNLESGNRGKEIEWYLKRYPAITKYAILDDDIDAASPNNPNFFKTTFLSGLTEEIANAVIEHLNDEETTS